MRLFSFFVSAELCVCAAAVRRSRSPAANPNLPRDSRAARQPSRLRALHAAAAPAQHGAPSAAPARPSGPITFTDVTAQAGIHFRHNNGAFGKKYLPETMGSGVCVIDYDNDGWPDILFVNSTDWPGHKTRRTTPALYHNNHDGTFTDVTQQAGLDVEMYGTGLHGGRLRQRRLRRHLHHRDRRQPSVSQSGQRPICRCDGEGGRGRFGLSRPARCGLTTTTTASSISSSRTTSSGRRRPISSARSMASTSPIARRSLQGRERAALSQSGQRQI